MTRPDEHACLISFLSGLAGTLAAGEAIKLAAYPERALQGCFEHVFLYLANSELRGLPGFRDDCTIGCRTQSVRTAFDRKMVAAAAARVGHDRLTCPSLSSISTDVSDNRLEP